MFCPQCHSEYREGFTRCSDCDVDLVEFLAAEAEEEAEPVPLPMVSVWKGMDSDRAERIAGAMRDAGIPAYVEAAGDALEIQVPRGATGVAREFVDEAPYHQEPAAASKAGEREPPRMCPLCLTDFLPHMRFCLNCLAPLVEFTEEEKAVVVWESDTLGDAYQLSLAMRRSGLPFHMVGNDNSPTPMLGVRRPLFERHFILRVLPEDEAEATKIIESLRLSSSVCRKRIERQWPA